VKSRALSLSQQVPLPITYESIKLDTGYRLDLVVEQPIIIEIKAIEALAPIHHAQLINYLKLSGYQIGFPMNVNVVPYKYGVRSAILQEMSFFAPF
jgi:GxxExxY protein